VERDELEQYESDERAWARQQARKVAPSGFISDIRPLFADQHLPSRFAFQRPGAPLPLLLLLYPTTQIYLPPTTREVLENRLDMPLEQAVDLQERGFIRPIIGHPTDYAGLTHFDPILKRCPPSVWARGDEVAHHSANAAEYWEEARRILPLDEVSRVEWVRSKWGRHYPHLDEEWLTQRVKIEVCTNYVDLCIFGFQPLARRIVAIDDPSWMVRRLLEVNEVATYPHLIGAAGTVNYGIQDEAVIESVQRDLLVDQKLRFLGPEAKLLTAGMGLSVPADLSPDALEAFHTSGTATKLWAALQALETELARYDKDDQADALLEASARATRLVQEAIRDSESISYEIDRSRLAKRVHRTVDLATKLASTVAIGVTAMSTQMLSPVAAWLAGVSLTAFASNLDVVREELGEVDERITDTLMSKRFSPLATQLWWVRRWRDNHERS